MTTEPKTAPYQYLGFVIEPDFRSPHTNKICSTQQGWRASHPAFPGVEHHCSYRHIGAEIGWAPSLAKAKANIDHFIALAKAGELIPERRDTYMTYFPNESRPMARGELTVEQQQAKNLADAIQKEWEDDKTRAVQLLDGHLVELIQEQCEAADVDASQWDDEQTLEVLEAAIAAVRRRLAATT